MSGEQIPIGLILTAKDQASPAIRRAIGGLGGMNNATAQNAKVSGAASAKARDFALKITGINQALELGKKAFKVFERAISGTIGKALEFRFSWDPARQQIENFGGTLETAMARVGDLFIPALVGLAKGLEPVIKGFTEWASKSDEVRQSKIVGFVASLARALVGGLAVALQATNKAWHGWTMLLNEATAAYHTMQAAQVRSQIRQEGFAMADRERESMEKLAQSYEDKADKAHVAAAQQMNEMNDLSKTIESIDKAMLGAIEAGEKFGNTYVDNAKRAASATQPIEAANKAMEDEIEKSMEAGAKKAAELGQAWRLDEFRAGIQKGTSDLVRMIREMRRADDIKPAIFEIKREKAKQNIETSIDTAQTEDSLSTLLGAWKTYHDNVGMLTTKQASAQESKLKDMTKRMASNIASSISGVINAIRAELATVGTISEESTQRIAIKGKEHFDKATKSRTRDVERYVDRISKSEIDAIRATGREVEVVSETVQIKTKTVFDAILGGFGSLLDAIVSKLIEFAALAVVGLFLNVITGGSVSFGGVIAGASKEALGFADGGLVHGPSGVDRVPAMLTAGEYVLPKPVVDSIRSGQAPSSPGAFSSGGMVSAPTARAERPVTMNFMAFTSSRTQVRRLERDVFGPERKRLNRNRVLREG